jgi:hypothetical protein
MSSSSVTPIGYYIHACLNILGVLLLLAGVIIAIFRSSFESWYTKHRLIQLSAITIIAISTLLGLWLRAYLPRAQSDEHWVHGTIGIILLIFLLLQAWWAVVMGSRVDSTTYLWIHRAFAGIIFLLVIVQVYLGWKAISM